MNPDKPSTDAPFDPAAVPIRAAATVMLVRDHPINGLEVFMLQRTLAAVFAKGMYVFPGGRVDANDNEEQLEAICDGLDDEEASALLGIPNGGLSYWVAAIRECFEEAGVLLARPTNSNELVVSTPILFCKTGLVLPATQYMTAICRLSSCAQPKTCD